MSVNNVKKLSGVAIKNSKNKQKLLEKLQKKPIKYNVLAEEVKKSSSENFLDELSKKLENNGSEAITKEVNVAQKNNTSTLGGASEEKAANGLDSLTEKLKDIEKEYSTKSDSDFIPKEYKITLPESLNQEKMEVPEINEEKLLDKISTEEQLKTKKEKESVENSINKEVDNLLAQISNTKETGKTTTGEINKIYDNYRVMQENDSLKRGLARSSVALLALENIEKSRAEELSSHAKTLASDIQTMENEILNLQTKLNSALENLDLELSVNINNKMAEEIEKLEKKRAEAVEFNNNIEKLEADYQAKRLSYQDEARELEDFLKEKYEGIKDTKKTEEMGTIAYNYFKDMDRREALAEIISSQELASLLGDGYYDLYYKIMKGK